MTEKKTILVIDDSFTIRRLVDSTLSREGYTVMLADNAETGIELALEHRPDMILLDHQLPGATGVDVCKRLIENSAAKTIPVVVSSTQRKKAFNEYGDMDNVVDMLSKPYSEELLLTTVANAIETGVLVVESQSHGTAVPEVMNAQKDSDFCGTCEVFNIREVLDFLNNGKKQGVLEVEADQQRYSIYLSEGRVVGVTASGVPCEEVSDRLPETLSELSSVVSVTMGRSGSALDSIVDLLNSEVLDPRLLRRLLRHQAAVLLFGCFKNDLRTFRFNATELPPPLVQRLPLDISILALLVEGACACSDKVPQVSPQTMFSRPPIRGQNLDRAGLTAQQSLVLRQLTSPQTLQQLATAVGTGIREVRKVLYGLELANLANCTEATEDELVTVLLYEPDLELANQINAAFVGNSNYRLVVVNDPVAAGLMAKRVVPAVVIADASDEQQFQGIQQAVDQQASTEWISIGRSAHGAQFTLPRPYDAKIFAAALDQLMQVRQQAGAKPELHEAQV